MRILWFIISAVALHVSLLALNPDNNSQKAEDFLVGVALVQRQMDHLIATADDRSAGQDLSSADATEQPLADQTDKVNVAERQEHNDEPTRQELPVEANHHIAASNEPLPDIVEEPSMQPVQRPRQPQPPPEPVADVSSDEMSASPPEQAIPPSADHPVVAETLPRFQRPQVKQGALVTATPQAIDGAQDAGEPLVTQVVAQPRYGYNPAPAYPGIARRRGWEGTVEFNVRVLTNGDVGEVTLKNSSGYRNLDDAARRAITRWRFTPASRAGKVIESWVVVPVHFVLDAQTRPR